MKLAIRVQVSTAAIWFAQVLTRFTDSAAAPPKKPNTLAMWRDDSVGSSISDYYRGMMGWPHTEH